MSNDPGRTATTSKTNRFLEPLEHYVLAAKNAVKWIWRLSGLSPPHPPPLNRPYAHVYGLQKMGGTYMKDYMVKVPLRSLGASKGGRPRLTLPLGLMHIDIHYKGF
jgi:hypothetical protein